ncbi:MAG: hypothetical protein ACUVV1_01240 [Fimbriimonadales bacterium]
METRAQSGDWRITTHGAATLQSRFRALARPATPFELMDDSISYYRENFRPLFRISLWIYLIPIAISLVFLIPIALLSASAASQDAYFAAILVDYLGLFLTLPYLTVAPIVQAAFTTLAFRMLAVGESITLRGLWERLKPRFWHLIANQLLAFMALSVILGALGLGYLLGVVAIVAGVGALAGGSPTVAIVLLSAMLLVVSIPALVLAALVNVWFLILPQIIVLEERTDAISAFKRAVELIRPNLRHATLSCLAFWGVQAVFMLAVMLLAYILLLLVVWIMSIYTDLEQVLGRWFLTLGQLNESINYIAYMLVMPAMYMTSILLYFDLRYRNEGLDIYEVLRQGDSAA